MGQGEADRLKGATRLVVHEVGGVDAAGVMLGVHHTHVSRYQNVNDPSFITIDKVARLEALDGVKPHITEALAENAGCVLIPKPRVPTDGKWSSLLGEIAKDCGDTIAGVAEALSDDGVISSDEIKSLKLRQRIRECMRELTRLDQALALEEKNPKGRRR